MMIDVRSDLEGAEPGEEPWCDLVFEIVSLKKECEQANNELCQFAITAMAGDNGRDVGFGARFKNYEWKKQERDNLEIYWGRVDILSLGEATDNLLSLFSNWFKIDLAETRASTQLTCLVAALGDKPELFESDLTHIKLFLQAFPDRDTDESYAELYFNFDLPARRAWLKEKDTEYRVPLVHWFAGQYGGGEALLGTLQ